ncbi:TPA: ATP-binding protein [Klebsiella pneumoniae subsp. pneumoniae]|uniref:P-loop NTPase fold protein n=1 Tax=Klebsiella variicola TaxID=244366 RepID=UPI002375F35F|nr:ATP-binding protein [Klebsiella pneumoniae]HBQ5788486.1 ATP-binding protein [Klebsiella pneumoniae subsp. pneumoniae]HCB9284879.1 ATP-binding protein [Klebsiella variicola]HCF8496678.1 ATP-binding protein [Klebsiella variicola subsp. variicola]HBQ5837769.1 ATP-binding protein [Klebsiella pneumoniae subsp. pneumoniae]
MNKETIISVLIRVLNEKRDGLILINGEWGVGKTYFLQTEFKNYYTGVSHFYLSALGLNNLQDFKDRMLSVTYFESPLELKRLGDLTSSATSMLTQDENSGKLAEQVISTLSGAMRDYVLKDLSGVLIIDDLERIPQSLRDEIATFCLQSYQSDNRLDFILVGNFSKQSNEFLNHKEKVISDEIYFSINNLTEILEKKLKPLEGKHKELITQIIIDFGENNLRIINRVTSKLIPLFQEDNYKKEISDIDIKNLVSSLCAHIILKEKYSYQEDDFQSNYINSSLKTLTNSNEKDPDKISKEESNLLNITVYKNYNDLMIPYCFNMISQKDIMPYVFSSQESLNKSDYAALKQPELYNISEEDYIEEIKGAILKTTSPKLSTWLTATNNYLRLSKSNYIPHITGLSKKVIEKNKKSFSINEIKNYFQESTPNINNIPLSILKRDGDELYNYFLSKYIEITEKDKITRLKDKMNKNGWSAIDMDMYQSKFKFKLLETLDVNLITDGIKKTWTIHDIQLFSNHLSSLYNFSNLADFLSGELPYLNKLYSSVSTYHKRMPKSFRRGAIFELAECIKYVKECLEQSIALNNSPT